MEVNQNIQNDGEQNNSVKFEKKEPLPEFYKDFIQIKFGYGKAKKYVKKFNKLNYEKEEKNKKK